MDGVEWVDNGDGTFTAKDSMVRFSSLDLYAMGIIPPASRPGPAVIIAAKPGSHTVATTAALPGKSWAAWRTAALAQSEPS